MNRLSQLFREREVTPGQVLAAGLVAAIGGAATAGFIATEGWVPAIAVAAGVPSGLILGNYTLESDERRNRRELDNSGEL
jgi:hypothetical protein